MSDDASTTGEGDNPVRSESPLRLRRRVRKARAIARPYKIEVKRFSKFLVVGAIGFVVDSGVFNLLLYGFPWLHLTPAIAASISLVCAIVSNFLWNHYWVYPDAHGKWLVQFAQFFLVNYSIALLRYPLISFTHEPFDGLAMALLGVPARTADVIGNNSALVLAVAIGLVWNFSVNRLWTYRHAPRS